MHSGDDAELLTDDFLDIRGDAMPLGDAQIFVQFDVESYLAMVHIVVDVEMVQLQVCAEILRDDFCDFGD